MAWNELTVIDMDSHIQERPHQMYEGNIDKNYYHDFQRLKTALVESIEKGNRGAIAASRHAILAPVVSDNALGVMDSFGLT
ncbi:uncharacterized protein METZ01_LOCUS517067, partial [marine metagenome]